MGWVGSFSCSDLRIQFSLVAGGFGERLREHRENVLAISQDVIATRLGISQQQVSALEKARLAPKNTDRLWFVADAYRLDRATAGAWAAEASAADAGRSRRSEADLRKQYAATLAEMRQIVEVNRDINEQIGQDIAEIRDMFIRQTEVLEKILAALDQRGPRAGG